MKARIVKPGCMFYGEVYGIWENLFEEYVGWRRVTQACFSEWGAKQELKKWKKENCPKEFEL